MSDFRTSNIPDDIQIDPLADQASNDVQLQAARLAQEAFAAAFRLGVEPESERRAASVQKLAGSLREWAGMATRDETQLRLALLLAGMDQWGLAYGALYGAAPLAGVSDLVGNLRNGMGLEDEASCQRYFAMLGDYEHAAFEFKVTVRRNLHMALWHAMIAAEDEEEGGRLMQHLGSLMCSLVEAMPSSGWRLVADAVANIQIRCLSHSLASEGLPLELTQLLFASVGQALPEDVRARIMASATQAVIAWQQARPRQ